MHCLPGIVDGTRRAGLRTFLLLLLTRACWIGCQEEACPGQALDHYCQSTGSTPTRPPLDAHATARGNSSWGSHEDRRVTRRLVDVEALERVKSAQLVRFLVEATSPHYLYLVLDHEWPGSTEALRECWKSLRATVVIPCSSKLDLLEEVLHSTNHFGRMRDVMLFCSPQRTLEIFKMVRERSLESRTLEWTVVVEGKEDLIPALSRLLREGTQVTLLSREADDTRLVWSSYIDPQDTVQFERRGRWRKAGGRGVPDAILKGRLFPDLERLYGDLQGRKLVAAVLNNWPFFGLQYLPAGGAVADSGLDVSVLNALSRSLNFTYSVEEPSDGQWGGPQPDGTISGIIGMVARHEAHLAINEITITVDQETCLAPAGLLPQLLAPHHSLCPTESRETVVDFTHPYFLESTILVSRAPAPKSRAFAVFSPFSPVMWILLSATTALMGPLAWLLAGFFRQEPTLPQASLENFAFNVYGSLLWQSNMIQANQWSLRILFFVWYIFCYIIYAVYSGTLTAFLAIPSFERPIDSLTDLLEATHKGFVPVFLVGSSNEFLFRAATSGIFHQVWQAHDPTRSFAYTIDEAMDVVLKGKRVFVNARLGSLIRATIRGRHKFYLARQTMYPQGYGVVCRSGAPYKRSFEKVLIRMSESGLVDKWTKDQVTKVPRTSGSAGQGTRLKAPGAITLHHLQGAFYIVGLGFLLATVVLLCEVCCHIY